MSVCLIEQTTKEPIPRGASYRVFSQPENLTIQKGEASRSIAIDLDPGKYLVVVRKSTGKKSFMKWIKTIYHGMTEAQFEKVQAYQTRFTKGVMTSDGVSYRCQMPGCGFEATSRVGAVLHEGEHSGVNLLADTTPDAMGKVAETAAQVRAVLPNPVAELRAKVRGGVE